MSFRPFVGALLLTFSLLHFFVEGALDDLPVVAFEEGYTQLFGDDNLVIHRDGKSVHLTLDERTGFVVVFAI